MCKHSREVCDRHEGCEPSVLGACHDGQVDFHIAGDCSLSLSHFILSVCLCLRVYVCATAKVLLLRAFLRCCFGDAEYDYLQGDPLENIKKHQTTIIQSLKDADIRWGSSVFLGDFSDVVHHGAFALCSIRRRALDLLYCMCDRSNAGEIVGELLEYLAAADFAIREELVRLLCNCVIPSLLESGISVCSCCISYGAILVLLQQVLKVAILAEKFSVDYSWYVDVILNVIQQAGDFVSEDIWHRLVQIVTNTPDVQKYAADCCFQVGLVFRFARVVMPLHSAIWRIVYLVYLSGNIESRGS